MSKKLLSAKSDFIFKLIFGDHKNVDILADFLMSVLDLPREEYEKIEIVDPHLKKEWEGDKLGILDVKLHTKSRKVIDIEVFESRWRGGTIHDCGRECNGKQEKCTIIMCIFSFSYNILTKRNITRNFLLFFDIEWCTIFLNKTNVRPGKTENAAAREKECIL